MPFSDSVSRKVPLGLSPGCKASVHGLEGRDDLNGRLVALEELADDGRWRAMLLGDDKKVTIAIKSENLLPAPPSALLITVPAQGEFPEINIPLACSVGVDGYGNKGVRLMYSEFLGLNGLVPAYRRFYGDLLADPDQNELKDLTDQTFLIATSPYQGKLADNECVVVVSKYPVEFDRLVRYQCLEDTGKKVQLGMHKDSRICRIMFPYDIE